ncbi:MAG: S-layer homology domain-containing protein [Solibacillus sp.]
MANQPTKYKKFVATAATATLVASAIVPVASAASFTDVNEDQAQHIDALVEQGIIKGYEDGTFKPNQSVTRGQVVKMLGKWVEAQGFAVPADWETKARFTDLAVTAKDKELLKYAAVVADAEVFNGSNGVLNAGGKITRENMALVLDRAYKAVYGTSLVEAAAGTQDITVADLALAKAEAREAIQAIRNLEISTVTNFNPKGDVTRANFAKFLNVAINVEGGEVTTPETGEVKIASVKTTGSKELTVEFNKAVDTEAAKFELKRGNAAVSIKDVKFNDAGTTAVVELEAPFAEATYNLTVTGVAEEALTASITTTKSVATEIKFNSEKLVLNGQKDSKTGNQLAVITFDVYNQYGEIITDEIATSKYKKAKLKGLKSEEPTIKEKGILTVWIDEKEDDGDTGTLSFTYEDGDLEIDVTQDVELSDEVEAGKVTIKGVHSKAGYDFTAANVEKVGRDNKDLKDGKFTNDFVLLFEVTDQFGAKISPDKVYEGKQKDFEATSGSTSNVKVTSLEQIMDGLRIGVADKDIFEVADEFEDIEILTVDGKDYFAAKLSFSFDGVYLEETGENTVTFRAKATGDEASSKINLSTSAKIQSVDLSSPKDTVAGDEDIYIPVTAKDLAGNVITNVALLNQLERDGEIEVNLDKKGLVQDRYSFVAKDGETFLKVRSLTQTDEDGLDVEVSVEVDKTRVESEIEFTIEEDAVADRLSRLSGVSTAVYYERNQGIELADIVILDQYGRVFDETKGHYVTVTSKDTKKFTVNNSKLAAKGDEAILVPNKTDDTGSASIEFELFDKKGESLSKMSTTFRLVNAKNFTSYKVEGTDTVHGTETSSYVEADQLNHEVKVFGITASGDKVRLPDSAYTILSSEKYVKATNIAASSDSVKLRVVAAEEGVRELYASSGVTTLNTSISVVISQTGEVVTRDIKLTDANRKVAKLGLEDVDSVADAKLTSTTLELTSGQLAELNGLDLVDLLIGKDGKANLTIDDQYGFDEGKGITYAYDAAKGFVITFGKQQVTSGVAVTVSNVSNEDVKIANNGNVRGLKLTGLEVNDSFALTLTADGVSATVLVHVTAK